MVKTITLLLFSVILISSLVSSAPFVFNLTDQDKNNKTLGQDVCNKDTEIDFNFDGSANLVLSSCSSGNCAVSSPLSLLRFFDSYAQNLSYSLDSLKITSKSSHPDAKNSMYFKFINGNNSVFVQLPFTNIVTSNADLINLDKVTETDSLVGLKNLVQNSAGALTNFNFLNLRDYGHFYTVSQGSAGSATTLLTSSFIFYTSSSAFNSLAFPSNDITGKSFAQYVTGDKLCYGSLINTGIYQTHMRQSFPLWTAWFGILLYWIYNLLTEPSSINCYDKSFQNNKWTCWSFYSLFFLGNEDYFTKLSRSAILLASWSWQACVLACIYGRQYTYNDTIIIWSAVVAWLVSIPFPFALGYFFMRNIYQTTINKFEIMRKIKELVNKDSAQALQSEIDNCQQKLYGLYYWFYVIVFTIFVFSWIIAVHMLVELPRQYYRMHYLWIGSLAITFAIDNIVFQPIMSVVFGQWRFWRVRGHFYDFKLGQLNKIISD